MGLYGDGGNTKQDKVVFFEENGVYAGNAEPIIDFNTLGDDSSLVCLVDNGPFVAAAVAYSEEEMRVFSRSDGRPKTWYVIDNSKIEPLCPCWDTYKGDK